MNITLEKVLQEDHEMNRILGIEYEHMVIPLLIATLCIIMLALYFSVNNEKNPLLSTVSISIGLLTGITSFLLVFMIGPDTHNKNIEEWKEEYAYPYIEHLNIEKNELEQVNLGFSRSEEEEIEKSKYTQGTTMYNDLVPVEVIYLENGSLKNLKIEAKVNFDLEPGESPYMEYQYLKEDLPNKIKAGYYNLVIHTNK